MALHLDDQSVIGCSEANESAASYKIFNCAFIGTKDDWCCVIGEFSFWFRVNSYEVELVPPIE